MLHFAHDAGVKSPKARRLIRSIELAPGTGMFGRAVAERAVIVTRDYPSDPSFRHAKKTDQVVADMGIRSMVVAPLTAGTEVFGAIGTFSTHEPTPSMPRASSWSARLRITRPRRWPIRA